MKISRSLALFLTAATFSGSPALAQGPDWTGYYAGLNVGSTTDGGITYIYNGSPGDSYDFDSSMGFGVFGGAVYGTGNFLWGFEASAQAVDYMASNTAKLTTMFDLKIRGGAAADQWFYYGFVGASAGDWDNNNGLTNPIATGYNVGFGADYAINDRFFAGGEYIYRSMDTDFEENDNGVEQEFGVIQLRVGMRF